MSCFVIQRKNIAYANKTQNLDHSKKKAEAEEKFHSFNSPYIK